MAWKLLPVNYTDAVWTGLKKYNTITNDDGTVSFQDVTSYSNKETSFFGAKEANQMNEALNTLMCMVENGTDLYSAFQLYFDTQKDLFEKDLAQFTVELKAEGDVILDTIKTDYRTEVTDFENQQEQLFLLWFDMIKDQLSKDAAGNLMNLINTKADWSKEYIVKIPANSWSESAPYTQTISVEGMVDGGKPLCSLKEFSRSEAVEYSKLTKMVTDTGSITFEAGYSKPTKDINVKVEVFY